MTRALATFCGIAGIIFLTAEEPVWAPALGLPFLALFALIASREEQRRIRKKGDAHE